MDSFQLMDHRIVAILNVHQERLPIKHIQNAFYVALDTYHQFLEHNHPVLQNVQKEHLRIQIIQHVYHVDQVILV